MPRVAAGRVWRLDCWREPKRQAALAAKSAASPNPIIVFIMSLFLWVPATGDRIQSGSGAEWHLPSTRSNRFRGFTAPRKVRQKYRECAGRLATLAFPKIRTRRRYLQLPE